MENYKEIVTKAVVGKAKKTSTNQFSIIPDNNPDTILGCWVINHRFSGTGKENDIRVDGNFDINVWYSYDNDTKTAVKEENLSYTDTLAVHLRDKVNDGKEIIVRSLKQPTVNEVKIEDGKINLTIEKELGVEVVGNTMIKVPIQMVDDDYEDVTIKESDNVDKIEVTDDYIK